MNRMTFLRLLLVFTFAMCADKNLAMDNEEQDSPNKSKEKLSKIDEFRFKIGDSLNKKPFLKNTIFFFQKHMILKFRGGREKNNWGWEKYWGIGVYGLIFYPDVYKSKWLKIGFLDFYLNFINFAIETSLLLVGIPSQDALSPFRVSLLYFEFFNCLSIKMLYPEWVFSFFYELLCNTFFSKYGNKKWDNFKTSVSKLLFSGRIQIDFDALFNSSNKEETELDLYV